MLWNDLSKVGLLCFPFNQARFIWARAFLSFFKGRHKSLCVKVGKKICKKCTVLNYYYKSDKRRKCCSRSSKQDMKWYNYIYEYSRNIVHVTYMHVYSHNVQSPCVGLRSVVGSAPDHNSRGREFVPQPGHITFKETGQNDSWTNFPIQRNHCHFINTGESMCTQYWLTA